MLNKKGMSPLLLTIILIALAVALGAMVMSWGSNQMDTSENCDDVNIVVQQAFNTDLICFNADTSKLKIVVKSTGKSEINALIYRRINPDMSIRDTTLPSSKMSTGRVYEAEIPHQMGTKVHIEIIPQILVDNQPKLCDNKMIIRENIPACPN